LARQLHPRRRRAQRLRHLPAAPQGGRHRPPDDPVRHGVRAAHHGRHAAGKPAPREGAARGAGEELGVIERLAIVGVGLLGGSVAKAARAHGLAREIVGVGREQGRLRPAVTDGTLDRATTDLAEGLRGAERVILAATVLANETLLPSAWRAVAAISHLPHVVAWALVDAVARFEPDAFAVAARGFKDTTRIAASDPDVWREILLGNRDAVVASLAAFRVALDELERLVARDDGAALTTLLARLKAAREKLS